MAGNFAEVYLAKQGHDGLVGINYLEKVQLATPAAVYGAMLAGVDYVLMGAGIPAQIPQLLDALAAGRPGELDVTVAGADPGTRHVARLDPAELFPDGPPPLARPAFLAIISSAVLAVYLARSPATAPDGFVLEGAHRGRAQRAAPRPAGAVEQQRARLRATGHHRPGESERAGQAVLDRGRPGGGRAAGPRAGRGRGRDPGRHGLRAVPGVRDGGRAARRAASAARWPAPSGCATSRPPRPAGFPFKVAQLPGTLADDAVYAARARLCDLGYLRVPYQRAGAGSGYRCPAEPPDAYQRKGGDVAETAGRRCLCNGLLATIGLGQRLDGGGTEPPVVTLGQDLGFLPGLVAAAGTDFTRRGRARLPAALTPGAAAPRQHRARYPVRRAGTGER